MRKLYPVNVSCGVLEVSASGYFNWLRRRDSGHGRPARRHSDEALLAYMRAIHAEVKGEYGWPRMHKELLARGIRVGKNRVRKLMQQHGIRAKTKRKFVVTTDSRHSLPVAPDLVQRRFNPEAPNQLWSGDITYIQTDEGWLYLAAVIDLFNRQVVGWSLQPHMQASLVKDALAMAWWRRRPPPGVIFHSDRGSDPEMHSSQKGNEWHFGMKAHIGVDADSGLVHTVIGTSGNVADVVEGNSLLHGQETDGFGDAGYQGIDKRPDAKEAVRWHIAMRPGKRRALDKENNPVDALIDQVEKIKASIRAKVEHPFRVIKRQFGYTKVRYRGLKKNTLQLKTLFALSNLWMVRHQLLEAQG